MLDVITVTKNDPVGLKRTGESIRKYIESGLVNWIVIDGGTQPNQMESLLSIAQELNAILVESQLNIFESMNLGFQIGRNPLVLFLNSGDALNNQQILEPVLSDYAKNHWCWAVANALAVNEDGEILWVWPNPPSHGLSLRLGILSFCHQATFINRNFLNKFMPFDVESIFSDWIMSVRLFRQSKPRYLSITTTLYLAGGVSSRVTPVTWANEVSALRIKYGVALFNSKRIEFLAKPFLRTLWRLNYRWQAFKVSSRLKRLSSDT